MFKIKNILYRLFPEYMKKLSYKRRYERLAHETEGLDLAFMNYGYSPLDPKEQTPRLEPEYMPYRFHIQLYHHVANQIDLMDLEVLEVASGRGGGAYYIKKYLRAKRVIGMDLSKKNVALSAKTFHLDGLSFRYGDAENIPFKDCLFDAVVNIESSHCYPKIDKFFQKVTQVLRSGGHFLYADFGTILRMGDVKQKLDKSGLKLVKSTDITANVVESLRLDNKRKINLFKKFECDKERYRGLVNFARMVGTGGYNAFCNRDEIYLTFLLQKP